MKNKNKKKKNQRKLSSLVLMLFLTIVMISVATYAWFTSNRLVKINTLNVNVQASEGFQISADGVNWKSVLQAADFLNVTSTYNNHLNHIPSDMVPVSNNGIADEDTGLLDMYLGTVTTDAQGDYALYSTQITETTTTGQYIAFDLFFRTNNQINLILEKDAGVKDIATVSNRQNRGMENATRIGFVYYGFLDAATYPSPSGGTAQAIGSALAADGSNVFIWEPNYKSHTEEAKIEAFNMYNVPVTSTIYNDWIPYSGIQAVIPDTSPIKLPNTTKNANPTAFGHLADDSEATFILTDKNPTSTTATGITLEAGVSKFRIYMWLEGQDYDCGDSASGSDIAFDMLLSATRVENPTP